MPWYRLHYLVCALIFLNLSLAIEERRVEEQIVKVLDELKALLNQSYPIMMDDIDTVFDKINNILSLDTDNVMVPGELFHLLNELGAVVDLNGSYKATNVRDNIALLMADTTPANPIFGMAVARRDSDILTQDSVTILSSTVNPDMMLANVSEMVVLLPASVRQQPRRVSFMVFRDGRIFNNGYQPYIVNSRVVSVNVQNYIDIRPNEDISIYVETVVEHMDTMNHRCAYWQFLEDGTGYWSEETCTLFLNPPQLDICRCDPQALAYFGQVLIPEVTSTPTTSVAIKTILSPQEQIQQVMDNIQQLLRDHTAPILIDDVNQAIDQINDILKLDQDDLTFPSALLRLIDELGTRVDLNGSYTEAVVRENIALLISDTMPDNPILGIALASRDTDTFTEDSFKFLSYVTASILSINVSEAVVSLPLSVTKYPRRISFVVFRDARVFNYNRKFYSVNSKVIGINVVNFAPEEYEVFDVHLRPLIEERNEDKLHMCSFWNGLEDGTGYWPQEGCTLFKSRYPWTLNMCRCDHLTHIAQVVIPHPAFVQYDDNHILRMLAASGSLLSIFAIILIALTAVLFRRWRNNFRNQIWLQLCVVLFLLNFCYLISVFAWFDKYSALCMVNGIGIYFSILSSYCWMLTVAFKACSELYLSPDTNPGVWTMLLAFVFSWGLPVIKIVILGISDSHMEPFKDMHSFSKFCKPSGTPLFLEFFTPSEIVIVIMVASWLVFFSVIYKLDIAPSNHNEQITDRNRDTLAYARVGLGLVLLSGFPPWIFGLFTYSIVGAYFYSCTTTTQGLILFFFVICGDPFTRNLWLDKLNLKRQCESLVRQSRQLVT